MISFKDIISTNNSLLSDGSERKDVSIYFLRNYTIEGIEPFINYYFLQSGLKPKITFGNFDNIQQEILDKESALYAQKFDFVVLSIYLPEFSPSSAKIGWTSDDTIGIISGLLEQMNQSIDSAIIINNFLPPVYSELGITNSAHKPVSAEVMRLNLFMYDFVQNHRSKYHLIDQAAILQTLGADSTYDHRFWYTSKAPFKKEFLSKYAEDIAKIAKAKYGLSKKCLILDCDNTLWGGIIGEDGIDDIKLDKNNYPGIAFYEFQQTVLNLHNRGVIITICSKNNKTDALSVFENHPFSLIKPTHIAAYKINWENKAKNIADLATELNIGLDSMVFVDDSDTECELVKSALPEVTVLKVPNPLYTYKNLLLKNGLFDTLTLSDEDRVKNELYKVEQKRKGEQRKFENIEDFISSLNIRLTIHKAKKAEIPRVAQLTQKTNQFNLTTRRYSEADIQSFTNDANYSVYSLSVSDKFGEMGITGCLIAHFQGNTLTIDSMLMSCRILGRNIEKAFASYCIKDLFKTHNASVIKAEYISTNKNTQVQEFWENFNFSLVNNIDKTKTYSLHKDQFKEQDINYINITT